jgi:hypothetical protein
VQTQSDINKMQVENLGMIFGPTLMQPNSSNNENVYQIDSRHNKMISDLIQHYKRLYDLTEDETVRTREYFIARLNYAKTNLYS